MNDGKTPRKKPTRPTKRLAEMPGELTVRERLIRAKVLTVAMMAEVLDVSEKSVYKAVQDGRLPTLPRIGGVRFDGVEIARRYFPLEQKPGQRYSKTAERSAIMKILSSGPGRTLTFRRSPR
jgi:predicted DNA-binding transcriptional regulator AlpA